MSDEVTTSDAAFEVAEEIVFGRLGVGNAAAVIQTALTAARDQGYNEGIEAAAKRLDEWAAQTFPVAEPEAADIIRAIRKLERVTDAAE